MAFTTRVKEDRTLEDMEGRALGTVAEVAQGLQPVGERVLKRRWGRRMLRRKVEYSHRPVQAAGVKRPLYQVAARGTFEHLDGEATEGDLC